MENTVKKITKMEKFTALHNILIGEDTDMDVETLIEFCKAEMAALEAKAAKAKERADKNKASNDALKETVFSVLSDEPKTAAQIAVEIGEPDMASQKITSRLTALAKEEPPRAEKVTVKVEVDGKNVNRAAYVAC